MTAKKSARVESWRVGDLALQDVLRVELPVPEGARLSVRLRNITMADLDWQIKKERELRTAELLRERRDDKLAQLRAEVDVAEGELKYARNEGEKEKCKFRLSELRGEIHKLEVGEDASPNSLAFLKEYKQLAEGGETPEQLYNVALVRQDYHRQMLAFLHQIDGGDLSELKAKFDARSASDDAFAGVLMEAYSASGVLPIAEVMARLEVESNEGVLKRAVKDLNAKVGKKKRAAAVVGGMILTAAFSYACGYLAGRGLIFTLPWNPFTG